ncbi:carbohydrate kinase [Kitasatospora sp. NPDC057692]|uniref:carbohydrate kinase family protein n=1 Tax=Kitasatospora sp. NPDC057692 TaxID=3346215 RepID=UPI0036CBB936
MITVVGEAVMDLMRSGQGGTTAHPGGSPANVAVGLGRLGNDVALLTRLGPDAHGTELARHLVGSGVALPAGVVDRHPTSTAIAHTDESGSATYEFAITWQLPDLEPDGLLAGSACLHTGSIAATLEPGASTVRRLVERARGRRTVSYDPNCRPSLMGDPARARTRIESLVASADVVKASDEDLGWLRPGQDVVDVAREWLALGPSLVVVTRGAAGAVGVCRAGTVERRARRVAVADTVGAGDAFMAGLLDALNRRDLLGLDNADRLYGIDTGTLAELLDAATLVSSFTCTRPGANPPTTEELAAYRAGIRSGASAGSRSGIWPHRPE